ncbi:hypothetical protein SAMN06296386_102106 [Lachnospiraceae bacterium]|nr:hypothetical protein SAMN06296386_102106 [Lachnospiraceae bacterium]
MDSAIHAEIDAEKRRIALMIFIIGVSSAFLLFRLNFYPNVFTDEGNGMYDSWCLAKYGMDSHLIRNPIYLPGYRGQGQSVLYALIASLSLRIFGYKLWAFRLPLVLICIANMVLMAFAGMRRKADSETFYTVLAVGTSPWMLTVTRFGMDCNVAPFIFSIGCILLYLGCTEEREGFRKAGLISGAIVMALVCYSYNVSWIFLPVFMVALLTTLIKSKKVNIGELIIPAAVFIMIALPIMIFAVRSNISSLNQSIKILWMTLPKLAEGRAGESFIDISDGIIPAIRTNLYKGIRMFANGTDLLPWNSPGNFGPYYMFTLPFFFQGMAVRLKRKSTADLFVLAQFIGMIPVMLFVTPNYNHWIFIHFACLFTIGTGLSDVLSRVGEIDSLRFFKTAVLCAYAFFAVWFFHQYFHASRFTGWDSDSRAKMLALDTEKYEKVYVVTEQDDFLENLRFALPVSPEEFQATKDHPYSETEYTMETTYSNFELLSDDTEIRDNSLFLIQKAKAEDNEALVSGLTDIGEFKMYEIKYLVYEN